MLRDAGFAHVAVEFEAESDEIVSGWDDEVDLGAFVASARITGRKPAGERGSAASE